MATSPQYVGTPKVWVAQVSTANTGRDGSGTLVDVVTAGASGSSIDTVEITATGATTAGVVRLFIYDGTNNRLYKEILVTAVTPSTSVPVFSVTVSLGLLLPNGYKLKAAPHNAETFNVAAIGGDF